MSRRDLFQVVKHSRQPGRKLRLLFLGCPVGLLSSGHVEPPLPLTARIRAAQPAAGPARQCPPGLGPGPGLADDILRGGPVLPAAHVGALAGFPRPGGGADRSFLPGAGTGVRGIPQPMVDASLAGPGSSCYFYPGGQSQHRTINGIKVVVTRLDPATFQVCAAHAHGLSVFISTYGNESPRAVSIFRDHLRILGPDPSRWTAHPLG